MGTILLGLGRTALAVLGGALLTNGTLTPEDAANALTIFFTKLAEASPIILAVVGSVINKVRHKNEIKELKGE